MPCHNLCRASIYNYAARGVLRLMDLDDIAAAFWDRATAPVAAVAVERNG